MAKQLAPSKLVPGTAYTMRYKGQDVQGTYEGTGMAGATGPLKSYIANGFKGMNYADRFIFTVQGQQVLLCKAYTKDYKGGVAPVSDVGIAGNIVGELVKFYA